MVHAHILKREIEVSDTATKLLLCGLFVLLTTLGAYIRVPLPFTPVPVTLQTFFVILSGAMLGRKWGAMSQAGYAAIGAAGVPVFQGYASGMGHLVGPTGGYILGFIFASFLVGHLLENGKAGYPRTFLAMLAGTVVIFSLGLTGLAFFLKTNLANTLALGLYPFLPGAALKLVAAASLFTKFGK